ncbi:MAG TPA: hypothetical protein PKA53_12450, partial [Sphingobacterium sp.]|nr:hypothetical protein [Sphingobacterium sp.]
ELPKETDKTQLVARFTTSDNVTVTVAGVPQQSGVTKNNFSAPVDYIVTEGKTNARYTVTIANAADYVWTRVGAYTDQVVLDFKMAIHPTSHAPYFLYSLSNSDTDLRKAHATKYENSSWTALGGALSDGRIATELAMVFNAQGKLFVSFPDYATTPAQAPIVQSYDGSSWSVVGGGPVFPAAVSYTTMAINPTNNQPILFNQISDRNYTIPRRATVYSHFNGTAWNTGNRVTGREDGLVGGIMKSKTVGDAVYLAIYNATNPSTYSVYKLQNNLWTTIVDQTLEEGATGLYVRDFDMDVDQDGNIYIAAGDNASGAYKPRVKKYNVSTQTWSQVGSVIEVDQSVVNSRYYNVAVAPNGVVHIFYRNEQGFPTVQTFDSDTQDWRSPVVLESVSTKGAFVSLDFATDGTGYASYISEADNIVLYKYDAPAN